MNPQDLELVCSPYTKEIWIGGDVDLDLLSIFSQEYARIIEGKWRNGKLFKGHQWRRESEKSYEPRRKKGL